MDPATRVSRVRLNPASADSGFSRPCWRLSRRLCSASLIRMSRGTSSWSQYSGSRRYARLGQTATLPRISPPPPHAGLRGLPMQRRAGGGGGPDYGPPGVPRPSLRRVAEVAAHPPARAPPRLRSVPFIREVRRPWPEMTHAQRCARRNHCTLHRCRPRNMNHLSADCGGCARCRYLAGRRTIDGRPCPRGRGAGIPGHADARRSGRGRRGFRADLFLSASYQLSAAARTAAPDRPTTTTSISSTIKPLRRISASA